VVADGCVGVQQRLRVRAVGDAGAGGLRHACACASRQRQQGAEAASVSQVD
jgi:hypothetical protein